MLYAENMFLRIQLDFAKILVILVGLNSNELENCFNFFKMDTIV
jgi:hypothetical protein